LLRQLIDQGQQASKLLGKQCPSALPATVFTGQGRQPPALINRHRIETLPPLFGTGQDPSGVQLSASTAAGRFAALAAQQVQGTLDHGVITLEGAQCTGQSAVEAPKFLAKSGDGIAHDCIFYTVQNTERKHKIVPNAKR
jgi:hypothetical protein